MKWSIPSLYCVFINTFVYERISADHPIDINFKNINISKQERFLYEEFLDGHSLVLSTVFTVHWAD